MEKKWYRVTTGDTTFRVHATSYQHAAERAAIRINGHRATMTAKRVTGDLDKSGYFCGYRFSRNPFVLSRYGQQFHISEE